MKNDKNNEKKVRIKKVSTIAMLLLLEIIFVFALLTLFFQNTSAGIGLNVTVFTKLNIGNVYPEVLNVTVNNANPIDLVANSTKLVVIQAYVRDYNGKSDLNYSTVQFFDPGVSSYGSNDDNNSHYTNNTCYIDTSYVGDGFTANVTCSLYLWYNSDNATWNATVMISDNSNWTNINSNTQKVDTLLAIGLPDVIDYGTVNATNVSNEVIANVTNFGNIKINLSLEGYSTYKQDGNAMNCTLGTVKNISVYYEKYNLTSSISGQLTLSQFESNYSNLTTTSVIRKYLLGFQQQEGINEAVNQTYWRIYVPKGAAGTCSGNIIFGATTATGI